MSAFIVEDKTINGVIAYLFFAKDREAYSANRILRDDMGLDLSKTEDCERLGKSMFELNCNAVEQRYGAGEAKEFRDLDYSYRRVAGLVTIVQAYKSLQCWLYQCSEGDVPETSLLYSTMQRVCDSLAHKIAESHRDYDKAVWG